MAQKAYKVSNEINEYSSPYVGSAYGDKLLDKYKNKLINEFEIDKILKAPVNGFGMFIKSVFDRIMTSQGHIQENKNYKLSYFEDLISYMIDNICKYDKVVDLFKTQDLNNVYYVLTLTIHSHKYLNKIKKYMDEKLINKETVLNFAVSKGGFPTFIFWINFFNEDILKESNNTLLTKSIRNSDDRIFKWVLEKIKENKSMMLQKSNIIENLITEVTQSTIPPKYKLKRIKILSQNCNLIPYFHKMIEGYPQVEVMKELFKHYYKTPLTYEMIENVIRICQAHTLPELIEDNKYFYQLLSTDTEKVIYVIQSVLKSGMNNEITKNLDTVKNYNLQPLIEHFDVILPELNYYVTEAYQNNVHFNHLTLEDIYTKVDINGNNLFNDILKFFNKHDIIHKYCYSKISSIDFNVNDLKSYNFGQFNTLSVPIMLLTKFIPYSKQNGIYVNRILSNLRIWAKRKSKSKIINFKIKYTPVMQELINFKPCNKPVFKNGSIQWQHQKQKFTHLPPRHLLPYELSIYKKFLIREKADGILINNLTTNIYPACNDLINNQVKAEYIEDLELYFVFDIDIQNTSIVERYEHLRSLHPYTKNTRLQEITTCDELMSMIESERVIFDKFIEESKEHNIKWYPKVAFIVNNPSDEFKKELIQKMIINEESPFAKYINLEGKYNCDGLILSPLSSTCGQAHRDIKIKPKSMMTIDLLYDGVNWFDREKNKYNHLIKLGNKPKNGKIYRCYPVEDNKFQPREIRFDKKHPNNFDIINMIQSILKFDWSSELGDNKVYYQVTNVPLDKIYIKELEAQSELLNKRIDTLAPEPNKYWLDLGCGKGKLINVIKKYNPRKYVGLDIDENVLLKNIHQIDENDWVKLSQCNLKENWFVDSKWYNIEKLKFDYIVLNYSIMHLFDSEHFWKCLKSVCKPETKIVFNIVSDKVKSEPFKLKDAYMNFEDGKIKYSFPWSHTSEITELFIEKKDVEKKMLGNGFLIDKIICEPTNLSSYYDWYFIENKV